MYCERLEKAKALIEVLDLDAAILFSPEAQFYFLGHDSFAGVNTPQALILAPRLEKPVMVIWRSDAPMLPHGGADMDVRAYDFGIESPAQAIAEALGSNIGTNGRYGWDAQSAALNHALAIAIIEASGMMAPIDISVPIARLRAFKTQDEFEAMRIAGTYAEKGLAALRRAAVPGATEMAVAAGIEAALRDAGSDYWAVPVELASGDRSHHVHGTPTERVLEPGDLLHAEFGAVHNRYHAVGIQTVAVGAPPTSEARHFYNTARRCLAAGIAVARPGIPAAEIEAPALDILSGEGLGDVFAMRFGYSVGIGYPPTWLEPFGITRTNAEPIHRGMTFVMHTCILNADKKIGALVGGTFGMNDTSLVRLAGAGDLSLHITGQS
ncbi:Xaa-Pro peptidase family protein [Defluviimonas aestuarii]|uniref:M24 family metallopeptidase n=1 Tax=Albidovulum aestuarii TaxID=1130726 RepID=UPI00249A5156|nr:Xaa-Pro peptidase family protein [Defluviimonas aestuarii]MDI3337981.1 Xaa-Pro peptidase family protein [Defluviimonas aestuarii]